VNPDNVYFLLKLEGEGDPKHIAACRRAVLRYAHEIKDHLPQLAEDIFERYSEFDELGIPMDEVREAKKWWASLSMNEQNEHKKKVLGDLSSYWYTNTNLYRMFKARNR
jgi:hypothetical protein